jgi:hypothetical protein
MGLSLIAPDVDDSWEMKQKMDVMLQSLMKIENSESLSHSIYLLAIYLNAFVAVCLSQTSSSQSYNSGRTFSLGNMFPLTG